MRTNLSVQENKAKYNGIFDCVNKIYKNQGIRGFYRGIIPCLSGVIPLYAINFKIYKHTQNILGGSSIFNNFISGNVSIFCALSVCFPSDLIKKRIQMKGQYGIPNYDGVIDCVKDIYKKEGFSTLR